MTAYEIAAFYKGSYEPANKSAEAQMVVKMNAKDFEAILEELERRNPPTDEELKGRRERLESAIRPLIRVLAEDYHPHHTCIVRSNGYELSEGVMCAPIHDYIHDRATDELVREDIYKRASKEEKARRKEAERKYWEAQKRMFNV